MVVVAVVVMSFLSISSFFLFPTPFIVSLSLILSYFTLTYLSQMSFHPPFIFISLFDFIVFLSSIASFPFCRHTIFFLSFFLPLLDFLSAVMPISHYSIFLFIPFSSSSISHFLFLCQPFPYHGFLFFRACFSSFFIHSPVSFPLSAISRSLVLP